VIAQFWKSQRSGDSESPENLLFLYLEKPGKQC